MLKNILFVILILAVSSISAQNANTTANVSNRAANMANRAANTASNRARIPTTPTPVQIPSNSIIRGKVIFEDDNKPVRRTIVTLFTKVEMGRSENSALTDENGNFEIKDVKVGKYYPYVVTPASISPFVLLDFSKVGDDTNEEDIFKGITNGLQEITVDGIKNFDVKIPVKRGGIISGQATFSDGSPAPGLEVNLSYKRDGKLQPILGKFAQFVLGMRITDGSFQTDYNGFYRISGLPAGEYVVGVSEMAIHGNEDSQFRQNDSIFADVFGSKSFLNTYYLNAFELGKANLINVEAGKEQRNINITVPNWKLHKVSGKVISSKDGKPVKAKVYLSLKDSNSIIIPFPNPDMSQNYSVTDENGNWSFKDIPKGQYKLKIEPFDIDNDDSYRNSNANTTFANVANTGSKPRPRSSKPKYAKIFQDLTVENSDIENLDIKIGLGGTISGSVVFDKTFDFTNNFTITIFNEKNEKLASVLVRHFADTKVESNSKFITKAFFIEGLPEGKLSLKITSADKQMVVKSATANGIDLLKDSFELKEAQTLANVKIVLEKKE